MAIDANARLDKLAQQLGNDIARAEGALIRLIERVDKLEGALIQLIARVDQLAGGGSTTGGGYQGVSENP